MSSKQKIPKALREQVWITRVGPKFDTKCKIGWCTNKMNVFDYQCGHNVPESKGGATTLDNLVPICSRCNVSMGNQYTINQWNAKFAATRPWWRRIFGW
jgi:5-methylcytosine-specific restriction endonuclease McrA